MENPKRMHLFRGYGIELEYMIVDAETLQVKPVADELLKLKAGEYVEDVCNGNITWSNELVLHVIELKCTEPVADLWKLKEDFARNVEEINSLLKNFNARLLPTAAHPWMNPDKETFIWPHGHSEVYETYNRMFNCKGHGWSNLQSTHINLPFYDDEEFVKLHSAIRVILPLIPALSASSPVLNAVSTGFHDTRMVYYEENQKWIPSITGKVIPERVTSKRQYSKLIYEKIKADIEPFNKNNILNPVWVNSRGAIARFDRGSIEIRVMDIQESPQADLALVALIIATIKSLVKEHLSDLKSQMEPKTSSLQAILHGTVKDSHLFQITNQEYLRIFGIHESCTAGQFWKHLLIKAESLQGDFITPWLPVLNEIIDRGPLAGSILKAINKQYTLQNLKMVYRELADDLSENQLFMI